MKFLLSGDKLKDIDNKSDAIKLLFQLVFAVIGALALIVFNEMSASIKNVEKSVNDLNIKMAGSMQETSSLKEDFTDLKIDVRENSERIRELEKSKWKDR